MNIRRFLVVGMIAVAAHVLPVFAQTPGADPDRLVALRESFERAVERAAAPIRVSYLQELERLKTEYTKAGNLEAAIAVDREIKERRPNLPQSSRAPATMKSLPQLAATEYKEMATLPLQVGGKLYADANYAWTEVPKEFAGLKYAQPKGKHIGLTTFRVDTEGLVYLAVAASWLVQDDQKGEGSKVSRRQFERDGWKHLGDRLNLKCDDNGSAWLVFARQCKSGETFSIQTSKYAAPILLTN